ncbi:MAG: hypothetical protein ACKPKO_60640, partial [Candidatus Fonsibacter sp.]
MFHNACKATEAEAFGKVTLITVTPDMALHLYGQAASRGSPAMRLVKQRKAIALIMDKTPRRDLHRFGNQHETAGNNSTTCKRRRSPSKRATPSLQICD